MTQRRNRRAGVEDRWSKTVQRPNGTAEHVPSAAHGKGKRWRGRYVDNNGKEHAQGFDRKVDAVKWVDEAIAALTTGTYIEPKAGEVTIATLGASWLGRQTHLKPSSLRPVEIAWRVHVLPRWGKSRIAEIAFTDVQEWVSSFQGPGKGATTAIRAYGVLAAILDDAVRDRRLLLNPARGVNLPRKGKKEHIYLTHDQVDQLAREAGDNGPMVLLLAYCGLRWGEAAGLRVRDCDLLRRRVSIVQNAVEVGANVHVGTPKNHKQRAVPVPRFLVEHLARQCEDKGPDSLLFPGPRGFMRPPRGTGGWFAGAVKRSGVPRLTPHDLRHTSASLAVSAGANVKAVQRMLGHASAAMTLDDYADLFDDDLDAVADRLDKAVTVARASRAG